MLAQQHTTLSPELVLSLVTFVVGLGTTYLRIYLGAQMAAMRENITNAVRQEFISKENAKLSFDNLEHRVETIELRLGFYGYGMHHKPSSDGTAGPSDG